MISGVEKIRMAKEHRSKEHSICCAVCDMFNLYGLYPLVVESALWFSFRMAFDP